MLAAMTYSTDRGMGARGVPRQVVEAFQRLADQQRGEPERAMYRVLRNYGGGPLWIVEHVGDLIHRMSQDHAYDADAGWFDVREKIDKSLRTLQHRYGFRRELAESIASNACFRAAPEQERDRPHEHGESCAPIIAAYKQKLDEALRDYADAHRALPVYNRPQQLAQEAAVALGEQRYEAAEVALLLLQTLASRRDQWAAAASAYQLDGDGNPVPLQARPTRGRHRHVREE